MKKFLSVLLIAVMMITGSLAAAESGYTAGTYTASAKGYIDQVAVSVTFSGEKIESIEVTDARETPGIGSVALEELSKAIVNAQSLAVDIYAGATFSSKAILEAVENCVVQAGGDVEALKVKDDKAEIAPAEDVTADFIIIGGGAAGLTAGIHAAYNGVEDIILLEKMPQCGGSTAMSGGVMTRPAIEGDPEGTMTADEMLEYFRSFKGNPDDEMLKLYVNNSPADWLWFTSLEGGENTHMFHNTPENVYSTSPDGGGVGVINTLMKEAEKNGVDIRVKHDAQKLIQAEDGTILGVTVINADGAQQNFYGDAVLIATGGFANSRELLERFAGNFAAEGVEMKGHAAANGDGIIMGEEVGAALHFGDAWDTSGMNNVWMSGFSTYTMQFPSIMVNDEGDRFVREDYMYPRIYEAMVCDQLNAGHTGGFWIILNDTFYENGTATAEDVAKAVEKGEIFRCETIEDIAAVTNLPVENLKSTITEYVAMGTEDTEFGKNPEFMGKISAEGPFYVAPTHPVRSGTMGGLLINTKAEVLDKEGNPIPHLLAAGQTANGSFYDNYYYICGNNVMYAIVTGHVAGETAAALAK